MVYRFKPEPVIPKARRNVEWHGSDRPGKFTDRQPKVAIPAMASGLEETDRPPRRLSEVSVAFQPRNIAPEVLGIQVFPTNVGLAAEPCCADRSEYRLVRTRPVGFWHSGRQVAPRRIYQRGATSLQWTAEDRNGDKLVYDVYYKQVGETNFQVRCVRISTKTFSPSTGSRSPTADIFSRSSRKTRRQIPAAARLSGERISEPIDIDNTPPAVSVQGQPQITGEHGRVTFAASDTASYLTRAEYSVNGGDWQTVYADDGISDSPSENYTVQIQRCRPRANTLSHASF